MLQFTEPGNGGLGLECTGTGLNLRIEPGCPMANYVGANTSHSQGYKNDVSYASRSIRERTNSSLREMTGQNQPQLPETVVNYS